MSSHDDSFVASGSSPSLRLCRDCWLATDGVIPIEKGKQHSDYFVPVGEKPSKQFGLDLGNVRVSTLGTNGTALHFEFKELGPQTSRLILEAIKRSRAELINLECHFPTYTLRSSLSRQEAGAILRGDSQRRIGGAGMTAQGAGLAAVQEHIRRAFRSIHNDQTDQETLIAQKGTTRTKNDAIDRRANAYIRAALRSPLIAKQVPLRRDVHSCYVVEEPHEDAATLIDQTLRYLEGGRNG